MVLVEKHSSAERRGQANIYNRRVKGVDIDADNRVLRANKGECRKLVDPWGNVVYTVVNRYPWTHTFKVWSYLRPDQGCPPQPVALCFLPVLSSPLWSLSVLEMGMKLWISTLNNLHNLAVPLTILLVLSTGSFRSLWRARVVCLKSLHHLWWPVE